MFDVDIYKETIPFIHFYVTPTYSTLKSTVCRSEKVSVKFLTRSETSVNTPFHCNKSTEKTALCCEVQRDSLLCSGLLTAAG